MYTLSSGVRFMKRGSLLFCFPEGTGELTTAWLSQVTIKNQGVQWYCAPVIFAISLIIFKGRAVIFAGAPIVRIYAGTSRVTIAPRRPAHPHLCRHRGAGLHSPQLLHHSGSAALSARQYVSGGTGIGQDCIRPNKDLVANHGVCRYVDHALQAYLIPDNGITFNNGCRTNATWLPIWVFSRITTLCPL
jgi:hypothetical protein